MTLSREQETRIDQVISDVSLRVGIGSPGSRLGEVAEAEDIEVLEADLTQVRSGLSGILQYDEDKTKKNPVIFIHSMMSKARKRFTLAHELGHHFLHEGMKLRLDVLDYSDQSKDVQEESEANYFAASILVPRDSLIKKLKETEDIDELAEYYSVSDAVIKNRLQWIKNS